MSKWNIRRTLLVLAMGGSTFALFGTSFNPADGMGCNFATNGNYAAMYETAGDAVIQSVSDGVFGNIGTDYDALVRIPTTTFAQSVWANWLDARIPDDLPNNAIVVR